jgi:cytochrome c-type biogenesis protein
MHHEAGINVLAAFAAGAISFLSPCCLPLVPGYLAAVAPEGDATTGRRATPIRMLAFLLGFGSLFVVLGAGVDALGTGLDTNRPLLRLVASAVVTFTGLMLLRPQGVSLNFLSRPTGQLSARLANTGPFLLGAAFAIAWTPCIGPILGSILALAGAETHAQSATLLLAVYALGLAVPFVVVGLAWDRGFAGLRSLARHQRIVNAVSGVLLIGLGILLASEKLYIVSAHLQRWAADVHLDIWNLI